MNFFTTETVVGSDDIKVLPKLVLPIFKNPYRAFGIDANAVKDKNVGEYTAALRDTLRRACLAESPYFSGYPKQKLTAYQILVGYHLIRGTLPKNSAKGLNEALEISPHLVNFHPTDILPLLKPLYGGREGVCSRDYRGAKMLAVECKNVVSTTAFNSYGAKVVYTFQVHYCMRLKTIERDYDTLVMFHEQIKSELLIVPKFPELEGLFNKSPDHGKKLAEYLMKIHTMACEKGKFYPRLLRLLDVDFERVQSEEEGAIMAILDNPVIPPRTVWHLIDEKWLLKWRRFAMGRGPRRYLPPGPITNGHLLTESRKQGKKTLEKAKHYRCVNYNVWRFLQIVHGGGPCIARKEEEIYGPKGMSYLQAVIVVQCHFRLFLAKKLKKKLQMIQLSRSTAGRAVIAEFSKQDIKKAVEAKIQKNEAERTTDKVLKAINFTQSIWRKKKNLIPSDNLEKIQKDQEVFARARNGQLKYDIPADEAVVLDVLPIVHIGSSNTYIATIPEEMGRIPFHTKRLPGSEIALISESDVEQEFINGSKILTINNYPTSSLTYDQIKARLASAVWPITLELERPTKEEQLPTLDTIMMSRDPVIQYNAFKILLAAGMTFIKHNSNNRGSHYTIVRITDKEFLYRSRFDTKKKENELWQGFSLFNIKFVLGPNKIDPVDGVHESPRIEARRSQRVHPAHCIEIVAEDREIVLELADYDRLKKLKHEEEHKYKHPLTEEELIAEKRIEDLISKQTKVAKIQNFSMYRIQNEEEYIIKKVQLLVENMKNLAHEVKSSQVYVDKDGLPVKRTTAKSSLRKLL